MRCTLRGKPYQYLMPQKGRSNRQKEQQRRRGEGLLSPQTHSSLFADGLFPRLNQVEFEGQPRGVISEEPAAFVQCPQGTACLVLPSMMLTTVHRARQGLYGRAGARTKFMHLFRPESQ